MTSPLGSSLGALAIALVLAAIAKAVARQVTFWVSSWQWHVLLLRPASAPLLAALRQGVTKAPYALTLVSLSLSLQLPCAISSWFLLGIGCARLFGHGGWRAESQLVHQWKRENALPETPERDTGPARSSSDAPSSNANATVRNTRARLIRTLAAGSTHAQWTIGRIDLPALGVLGFSLCAAQKQLPFDLPFVAWLVPLNLSLFGAHEAWRDSRAIRAVPSREPAFQPRLDAGTRQHGIRARVFARSPVLWQEIRAPMLVGGSLGFSFALFSVHFPNALVALVPLSLLLVIVAEILRGTNELALEARPVLAAQSQANIGVVDPLKVAAARMRADLGLTRVRQAQYPVFKLIALRAFLAKITVQDMLTFVSHLDIVLAAGVILAALR